MIKRLANIAFSIGMILGIAMPAVAQQSPPLANLTFSIVGVEMRVGPEYQAVPKGIASQVTTGFVSNGEPVAPEIAAMLPLLGKHTLSNIRVVDAAGNVLFSAIPQAEEKQAWV